MKPKEALQLASDYWLKTIHPYCHDGCLLAIGPEYEVACDAHGRLRNAVNDLGPEYAGLVDAPEFAEPKPLCKEYIVKPQRVVVGVANDNEYRREYRRRVKECNYYSALPNEPEWADGIAVTLDCRVTIDQILQSWRNPESLPLMVPGECDDPAKIAELIRPFTQKDEPPAILVDDLCKLRWSRFEILWRQHKGKVTLPSRTDDKENPDAGKLGPLSWANDFQDVELGKRHYDLRRRPGARYCIKLLVERGAVNADKTLSFVDDIDPYVRKHVPHFVPSLTRRIRDYFGKPPYCQLYQRLIATSGKNRRYFIKVGEG